MGIVKKILYFLRLAAALAFFGLFTAACIYYFNGNNFLNLPFNEIENYIMQDAAGFTVKSLIVIAAVTLIFGRIWCSLVCPLGIFQEIVLLISRRRIEKRSSFFYKYILLVITGAVIYFWHEPLINFTAHHLSFIFWISAASLVLITVLTIFKGRFFCTDICPFGAFYGLIAKFSIFRMHFSDNCMCCMNCEELCPSGCIDTTEERVNNVTCVKCLRCFGACSENGMKYGIKLFKK